MCIIVAKPAGVAIPTWKRLEYCFDTNPDGTGYMWNDKKGRVRIEKGFMTFSEFKKAFKLSKRQFTDDTAVVFHFRIKTSGEVSKECCHPFPLDCSLENLRQLECKCEDGVAHNGVLCGRDTNPKKSDTMDFIMNYLYHLNQLSGDWDAKSMQRLVDDELEGDRLCILHGDGSMHRFGKWYEDKGCFYSNSRYEPMFGDFHMKRNALPTTTGYFDDYSYSGRARYSAIPVGFRYEKYCEHCAWWDVCDAYGPNCKTMTEVKEVFREQMEGCSEDALNDFLDSIEDGVI